MVLRLSKIRTALLVLPLTSAAIDQRNTDEIAVDVSVVLVQGCVRGAAVAGPSIALIRRAVRGPGVAKSATKAGD
jgi:hypothetical protein